VTKDNIVAVGVQLANCPIHKAIYKLQSKDNITGFARRTIFKGFKRLNNTLIENKRNTKTAFEAFPQKQIQQELQANSVNYNKARADVSEAQITRWFKSKGKKVDKAADKQVIEFAKNMFLSWDTNENTEFSIDRIVEELITMGVDIDNRIINSIVKSFNASEITAKDFLTFMKGDKVSMHISKILRQIADKQLSMSETCSGMEYGMLPKRSINYRVGDGSGTVIEVPLEVNSQKVILHTNNSQNKKIAMHFMYDKEGNLVEENPLDKSKKVREKEVEKLPLVQKNAGESALEEINIVKDWWSEIERKSGYTEDIPINIVADMLVEKGVVNNRDKAKQLLGNTLKHSKPLIEFIDFKQLLYKGVFRNIIKNLYTEVKEQRGKEEAKLPKFLQISNYKKTMLMTAFDPTNPRYQESVKIFERLKIQYEKMGKLPVIQLTEEVAPKPKAKSKQQNVKVDSNLSDYIDIMKKYKKLISTHPEYNEFLVYHGYPLPLLQITLFCK
jgi:hypothetical protein